MSVKLEVFESIAACESLKQEWEQLLCSSPEATVFDSFGWVKANLLAFQKQPNNDAWILAVRALDSSLVAVIPLVMRHGRRYARERRWVEFAGQPFADYGSCLVRPDAEAGVADSLVEFCVSKASDWDGIFLDRLRAATPFLKQISFAARNRGLAMNARETGQIRRLSKQKYAENSTAHSGKSLRKARARLSEQGAIDFEVYAQAGPILERLEMFFTWHVERFAVKGLRSPLADPQHCAFYRHIVNELAPHGRIWLSVLTCAGRPIAMRFSPVFGGTLHLYSTCFDEAFAKCSPSMLHLEALLDHAFRSGIMYVDFGLGESPQKELAGQSDSVSLAALEIYGGKMAALEGRSYQAVEQIKSRSRLIARTGKLLRRIFPYDVR